MTNWLDAHRETLPGDWAARPLYRLKDEGGQSAILIQAVPDSDPSAIEGHRVAPVAALNRFLKSKSINVPDVYVADPDQGILVLQDFGNDSWGRSLTPDTAGAFYHKAEAILEQFKTIKPAADIDLPEFQNSYIFGRTVWYLDQYKKITDKNARKDFLNIWDALLEKIRHDDAVHFVHGDFHPGNLMKLEEGSIGVLDVGGAFWGSGVYDLVNLLEDLRLDVPDDIRNAIKTAYKGHEDSYAIMHAQFYMRLAGQMTKRGIDVPKKIPLGLQSLVHRFDVLKPLKTLVLS